MSELEVAPQRALVATPQPVSPLEHALLEKLRAELLALAQKPPWTVLGISQGADPAQAKAAYFQASKRYHPHLFAHYRAPEIKQVVTELFIAHKRAYTTLLKSGKPTRNPR
jgi:preprotein translocase subunit Sec63